MKNIHRSVAHGGVLFGGNANNGTNAGFTYANSNNTPSNANTNIASRIYFRNNIIKIYGATASPLGEKHKEIRNVLVGTPPCKGYRRLGLRKQRRYETYRQFV